MQWVAFDQENVQSFGPFRSEDEAWAYIFEWLAANESPEFIGVSIYDEAEREHAARLGFFPIPVQEPGNEETVGA